MRYYKKITCGFIDWVVSSEDVLKDAIEISKEEYDDIMSDGIEDDTININDEF